MAAQSLSESREGRSLWFEDFTIDAPLGVDAGRDVVLVLEEQSSGQDWTFSVTSSPKDDQEIKDTCHGKGRLGFKQLGNDNEAQVYHYERLLTDRIYSISAASDTETLKSQRLYSMFSRIVSYGAILKGITSITLAGREAVAEVDVPPNASAQASSAGSICDTAVLDNFIQVAGLMLNSSNDCDAEEAFLAVGVKDTSISASSNFADSRSWTVYASYTSIDDSRACADVAVLSRDQALAATINGISFVKLSFRRLQKLLDSANEQHDGDDTEPSLGLVPSQIPMGSSGSEPVSLDDKPAEIDGPLQDLLTSILEIPNGVSERRDFW